jgi:hypothetical protein
MATTRTCAECDGRGGRRASTAPVESWDACHTCRGTGVLVVPDVGTGDDRPTCLHCGREMTGPDPDFTPKLDDEAGWTAESARHAPDCEWVRTRAFRRDAHE